MRVFCPTFRPLLFAALRERLAGVEVVPVDGHGALEAGRSKASLFNKCIRAAFDSGEDVAIVSTEKMLACKADVERAFRMVAVERYGAAAFCSWSFFAIDRETIRRVGWFDETFPGAGYEDSDYLRRCCFRDVGIYVSHEVGALAIESAWPDDEPARQYLRHCWEDDIDAKLFRRKRPVAIGDPNLPLGSQALPLKPWHETLAMSWEGKNEYLGEWRVA